MKERKKVLLIIMDGLGAAPTGKGNAVVLANPQNLSSLWTTTPHTYLLASGEAVGLPKSCLLYTSPSPRERTRTRMPSSA